MLETFGGLTPKARARLRRRPSGAARGASRFAALGLPTRRLERWHYTDLAALRATTFRAADEADARCFDGPLPQLAAEDPERLRLVFVNGLLHPALCRLHGLAAGVTVSSLAAAGDLAEDLCCPSRPRRRRCRR